MQQTNVMCSMGGIQRGNTTKSLTEIFPLSDQVIGLVLDMMLLLRKFSVLALKSLTKLLWSLLINRHRWQIAENSFSEAFSSKPLQASHLGSLDVVRMTLWRLEAILREILLPLTVFALQPDFCQAEVPSGPGTHCRERRRQHKPLIISPVRLGSEENRPLRGCANTVHENLLLVKR